MFNTIKMESAYLTSSFVVSTESIKMLFFTNADKCIRRKEKKINETERKESE